ncbi:MAG: arsenate reductase ArsC [Alphaproteobacteria bacterium]
MNEARPYNVLFLCSGNSARSIMAEAILNHEGRGRFHAYSAGSFPKGVVSKRTLAHLKEAGLSAEGLRSKSWDEFATPGAPKMDFVFTVCDDAAKEACPNWPGQPMSAHWSVLDPGRAPSDEQSQDRALREAFRLLSNRIRALVELPLAKLDRIQLTQELHEIGRREA